MGKTYIGIDNRYYTKLTNTNQKSEMLSTETYYFAETVTESDNHTVQMRYRMNITTPAAGTDAIGLYCLSTPSKTPTTEAAHSNYYLKVVGISEDGYLLCDKYMNTLSPVANQAKKIYLGVNDVAKKIKKGYIGDENGIARLVYSASTLKGFLAVGEMSSTSSNSQYYVGCTKEPLPTEGNGYNNSTALFDIFWETKTSEGAFPQFKCACVFKDKLLLGGRMESTYNYGIIQYVDVDADWKDSNSYTVVEFPVSSNYSNYTEYEVTSIATGNSVAVATLSNGTFILLYYSTDGINWVEGGSDTTFVDKPSHWQSHVAFCNGLFYLPTVRGMYVSANGAIWTPCEVSYLDADNNTHVIGNNPSGTLTQSVTNILYNNGFWYVVLRATQQNDPYSLIICRGITLTSMTVVFDYYNSSLNGAEYLDLKDAIFRGELQLCGGMYWFGAFIYSYDGMTWECCLPGLEWNQNTYHVKGGKVIYSNGYYYLITSIFYYNTEYFYFTILKNPHDTPIWYIGEHYPHQILDLSKY